LDGGDFQRLPGSDGNSGANVHGISSLQISKSGGFDMGISRERPARFGLAA
jgi:hypothetical protein